MNKKEYYIYFAIIALSLVCYKFLPSKKMDIIKSNNFILEKVEDSFDNGNSFIDSISYKQNCISYRINLKNGFKYPYAGIGLHLKKRLNFSKFDSIFIDFETKPQTPLIFTLRSFENGKSKIDSPHSYLYSYTQLYPNKKNNISLSNFKVPEWWQLKNQRRLSFKKNLINSVEFIEITNATSEGNDSIFFVSINKISVKGKSTLAQFSLYIAFLLSIIFIVRIIYIQIINFKNRKNRFELNHIEVKKTDLIDEIMTSLLKNYSNPDFSIEELSKIIGINRPKITATIKESTNKNFKSLLNEIRIKEASKLLKESNLQISEIAYTVGYNSISHFNRIFKDIYGISPTKYREENI